MNKTTKRTLLALLLLLLLSAVGWAFWGGEDPQIAKIKEMRAQIEQAPREQQRELYGKMREEYQKLSPESREALFAERRKQWQERERKQMGEFFAMSYAQQIAEDRGGARLTIARSVVCAAPKTAVTTVDRAMVLPAVAGSVAAVGRAAGDQVVVVGQAVEGRAMAATRMIRMRGVRTISTTPRR